MENSTLKNSTIDDKYITIKKRYGLQRSKNKFLIRDFLFQKGKSQSDIARELGLSRATVSQTVTGKVHSVIVLERLRSLGLPEELLCDPYFIQDKI